MRLDYDIAVVGAGHAGCEAARAAARLGARTLLLTMDLDKIAQMSCNPAVGGIAKGQIVREIDALGGAMGVITDRATLQFRMLNRSKGPAMWSPRAQTDRRLFSRLWRRELELTDGLNLFQDTVTRLIIDDGKVAGVMTRQGVEVRAKAVILTAGTFLNGLMHVGRVTTPGGRAGEAPSTGIAEQLAELGVRVERMKTGTPVRIDIRSVDLTLTEAQHGDPAPELNDGIANEACHRFSHLAPGEVKPMVGQLPCHALRTNEATHEVLRRGLPDSPLYNGQIQSIGPRYCPSIETKIVTFAGRNEHQLYLEPEGADTTEYYLNGFSSSLPADVQVEALRNIPALRNVRILRPGYAIEYDFFDPRQLHATLESRVVEGLWLAGQVNGTTGYEEAAGQGLIAGINAARRLAGKEPVVLRRDQAYIGVLIDDLVTKGVDEPYRMFTSRAEYRILLRQDNADERLTLLGQKIGLADAERVELYRRKAAAIETLTDFLGTLQVKADEANAMLEQLGGSAVSRTVRASELLPRPEVSLTEMARHLPAIGDWLRREIADDWLRAEVVEAAEIRAKYAGYIERERLNAEKASRLEDLRLEGKVDYSQIAALSTEARQKLQLHRPATIGQASRIPGVSPADVNILILLLTKPNVSRGTALTR